MNFWDKNQSYLARISIAIGDSKAFEPEDDAVYEKTEGHYLAKRKDVSCFVHSKYSVPHEIESMFATVNENAEFIVLFGHGCGEAVRYALDARNFPRLKSLTIVEPSLAWAKIMAHEMDLAEIWGEYAAKVSVLVGFRPDVIAQMVATGAVYIQDDFCTVYHMSVRAAFPEYCRETTAALTDQMRNIMVGLRTNKSFAHPKTYNEILNLALSAYDFVALMELFKGKNVIIVSAGPSLEKNIHLLEEAKKKAFVVAVGSAIRILDARGITPHFRMGLDPTPEEYEIFGKLKNEPVPIIYGNPFYPEILTHYSGPRIRLNLSNDQLGILLHRKRNYPTKAFFAMPTVANLAAEAFCACGCKTLAFVGQDMCMYDYQVYADSGQYEPYKNVKHKDMLELKDIDGNDVVSPRDYYFVKQNLEKTVARFGSSVEFINATEGGLGLRNVPNKLFADVLAEWEEDSIAPLIGEHLKKLELVDFQDELTDLREKIGEIDRLNDENLKNLQEIKDILVEDELLRQRGKYVQVFTAVKKNEKALEKINWYTEYILLALEMFLQMDCMFWEKDIDSEDEKVKFRSILEIQLLTAQATKSFTIILKRALKQAFAEEVKVNTFSLVVK